MIKLILKIFAIFFLVIIQVALMSYFAILGFWPNLILVLALILVINNSDENAFLVAGLGGILLDFASPLFFGFYTALLVGLCLIVRYLVNKFLTEISPMTTASIIALTSIIFGLFLSLVSHQFSFAGIVVNFFYTVIVSFILSYSLNFKLKRNSGFTSGRLGLLQ